MVSTYGHAVIDELTEAANLDKWTWKVTELREINAQLKLTYAELYGVEWESREG